MNWLLWCGDAARGGGRQKTLSAQRAAVCAAAAVADRGDGDYDGADNDSDGDDDDGGGWRNGGECNYDCNGSNDNDDDDDDEWSGGGGWRGRRGNRSSEFHCNHQGQGASVVDAHVVVG